LLFKQCLAQSEVRCDFLIVLLQNVAIQLLSTLVIAGTERLLCLPQSFLIDWQRAGRAQHDYRTHRAGTTYRTEERNG
jgi:hypothetical protein